jgi:hypothetical protein
MVEKKKKKIIKNEMKNFKNTNMSDPIRPFQSSPTIVDLTHDTQFESKWRPMVKYDPSKEKSEKSKVTQDEKDRK